MQDPYKLGDKAIIHLLQLYKYIVLQYFAMYRAREMNLGLIPQLAAANAGGLVAKLAKLENQPSAPWQKTNNQWNFNIYQYLNTEFQYISMSVRFSALR